MKTLWKHIFPYEKNDPCRTVLFYANPGHSGQEVEGNLILSSYLGKLSNLEIPAVVTIGTKFI